MTYDFCPLVEVKLSLRCCSRFQIFTFHQRLQRSRIVLWHHNGSGNTWWSKGFRFKCKASCLFFDSFVSLDHPWAPSWCCSLPASPGALQVSSQCPGCSASVQPAPASPTPSAFQMTFSFLESVTGSWGDRPGLKTHQPMRIARGRETFLVISIATTATSLLPSLPPPLCGPPALRLPSSSLKRSHTCLHLFCLFLTFCRPSSPFLFLLSSTPSFAFIWTPWPNK